MKLLQIALFLAVNSALPDMITHQIHGNWVPASDPSGVEGEEGFVESQPAGYNVAFVRVDHNGNDPVESRREVRLTEEELTDLVQEVNDVTSGSDPIDSDNLTAIRDKLNEDGAREEDFFWPFAYGTDAVEPDDTNA